jgi:hypothetical protein
VCPDTKTSILAGSRDGFIGGLLSPLKIVRIFSREASAGE